MKNLLKVENLEKIYDSGVRVQNINFEIKEGEALALIGESGSGKTTIARIIIGLLKKKSGNIYYDGKNIFEMNKEEKKLLKNKIQLIFQNPYSSLNPRLKIKDIILEGFRYQKNSKKIDEDKYLKEILNEVELEGNILDRYPHELSGGQNQRVGIARALIMQPKLLIADECFSALDMLTQKQILELFLKIKKKRNMSYLIISHDISVVKKIADKIIVLKNGKVVEKGTTQDIIFNAKEKYTQDLVKAGTYKKDF
ncbi:MAG: ABC transporter ATP-binding protein [Fusobacterium sp.]|nr:ABC transporter ATP-binding protein [Fusobacterium sp.]